MVNFTRIDELDRGDRVLSMAPLNHVMGLVMGLLVPWYSRNAAVLASDFSPPQMTRLLQEYRVTAIVTVPVFLDRVREKIEAKLAAEGRDFYLYHCTWEWGGAEHRYWFLSEADPRTEPDCWPSSRTSWHRSGEERLPPRAAARSSSTT